MKWFLFSNFLLVVLLSGCGGSGFDAWLEDSMVKMFPDSPPPTGLQEAPRIWIARNGHASIQLAVRPRNDLEDFEIQVPGAILNDVALGDIQVRRVAFVPVERNTADTPEKELVRTAPADFPDPLENQIPRKLTAGRTEIFWLTLFAPPDTPPGDYRGEIRLAVAGRVDTVLAYDLRVVAATVPQEQTLKVTNWFNTDQAHLNNFYPIQDDRETYWRILGNIGRVMAEHKQNAILTPVGDLVKVGLDQGNLTFDYSEFDRWVTTFQECGLIGTIEGGHLLIRPKGYFSPILVPAYVEENGELVRKTLEPYDPKADAYLGMFLRSLYSHLQERGWREIFVQHLHDEPHGDEIAIYEHYADLVRKNLPGIPTVDAVDLAEDTGFLDRNLDIWVPVLSSFDDQFDLLARHRASGGQTWYYTCVTPRGRYLNRFIDYSLLKVRLLHWFNFRHGLSGFLHWGGNYWSSEPFRNVEPVINDGQTLLPPGDNAIVYPDVENLSILSSIRLEMMREGIEDYELLHELAARNPARAEELARMAIPEVTDYVRDPVRFREIQTMLLEAFGSQ
jgi:hypothetical protein